MNTLCIVLTTFFVVASGLAAGCARDPKAQSPEGACAIAVILGLAALIIGAHL